MEIFSKDNLDEERFWAALAMPWLFAPAKVDGMAYTEGASHDPSGLGALLQHYNRTKVEYPGAEGFTLSPFNKLGTIVALETCGSDLWTNPETLYEALQVTIMEPIVCEQTAPERRPEALSCAASSARLGSKEYPALELLERIDTLARRALGGQEFIEDRRGGGEMFEKYRYYPSVKDKPRVKDMLKVFAELLAGPLGVGRLQ
jgi:hypothetical protein